jgi:hypothetical protein
MKKNEILMIITDKYLSSEEYNGLSRASRTYETQRTFTVTTRLFNPKLDKNLN